MTDSYVLYNEMSGLPLLGSYLCSFESPSGEEVTPQLEGLHENMSSKAHLVLRPEGTLGWRSGQQSGVVSFRPADLSLMFWMVIRDFPDAPETRIPFVEGSICTEMNGWRRSDEPLVAQVSRRNPSGYRVRVGDSPAFLPMSLVPEQYKADPESLVGMIFECEVIWADGEHPPGVRPVGPFITFDEWFQKRPSREG